MTVRIQRLRVVLGSVMGFVAVLSVAWMLLPYFHRFSPNSTKARIYHVTAQVCHLAGVQSLEARLNLQYVKAQQEHIDAAIQTGKVVVVRFSMPVRLSFDESCRRVEHFCRSNGIVFLGIRRSRTGDTGPAWELRVDQPNEDRICSFLESLEPRGDEKETVQPKKPTTVEDAKQELAELRKRYKDKHPKVQEQLRMIEQLEGATTE